MGIPKIHKMTGSCVLCALQYVSKLQEDIVQRACTTYGWTNDRGMHDAEWKQAANMLGINIKPMKKPYSDLLPIEAQIFINNYKDDLYLVGTHDHLFVVDHGLKIDPMGSNRDRKRDRRSITQVWRVLSNDSKSYGTIS